MDYKKELLKLTTEKEFKQWLKNNPMPKEWHDQDIYSWGYFEMPVGNFRTWWRRKILGWPI